MAIVVNEKDFQIERLELGPWPSNAYIIISTGTRESLLIDAPAEAGTIISSLKDTNPKFILLTHNHVDHVGALDELRSSLKLPLAAHAAESSKLSSPPERLLNDGDTIALGNLQVNVLHTPGHTPGSLCFKIGKYLLAGDTIFPGGPGNTRSPEALREIIKSITEKILVLPDDTQIYPGHGSPTALKKEKEEFAVFSSRPHAPGLCGDVLWLSS